MTREALGGRASSEMPQISIVAPMLNERDNVIPFLDEVETRLRASGRRYELVVVDDGSTDGTREVLRREVERRPALKVVMLRRNYGQSAAFDCGIRNSTAPVVVTIDADLQNDPADIERMVIMLEQGFDLVSGWRRDRQDRFLLRRLPSGIANALIRAVTHAPVHDLGCSLKVYRREIAEELHLYGEMHRFIVPLAHGMGARIGEVEVNHRARVAGRSKYGIARTGKVLLDLLTVWFLGRYQTKPIYVFGGSGLVLLAISSVTTLLVLWQKIHDGIWVHRNPLFLVAIFLGLMGIQLMSLGLIAEVIVRTYFESQRKPAYLVSERVAGGRA